MTRDPRCDPVVGDQIMRTLLREVVEMHPMGARLTIRHIGVQGTQRIWLSEWRRWAKTATIIRYGDQP
jgi:hypothetical protein